jgi:hypothetical protein
MLLVKRTVLTRLVVGFVLFVKTFASAVANEADIFESDSFLDPRNLGAEMQRGQKTIPGATYSISSVSVGYVDNYRDRSIFTDDNRQFLEVDYQEFWSDWQWGSAVTLFNNEDDATTYRGRLNVARYKLVPPLLDWHGDPYLSRLLFTLTIDDYRGLGTQYELAAEAYVQVAKFFTVPINGNISISYRNDSGLDLWRLYFGLESDVYNFKDDQGRIAFRYGFGYEGGDNSVNDMKSSGHALTSYSDQASPITAGLIMEYRVFEKAEVHMGYAFSYISHELMATTGPSLHNHEWYIKVNVPISFKLAY